MVFVERGVEMKKACPTCKGSGQVLGKCAMCNGTGTSVTGNVCQGCGGKGKTYHFCSTCDGTGKIDENSEYWTGEMNDDK